MVNPLLVVLERRDRLSAEERRIVEAMAETSSFVPARTDLVRQGDIPGHSTLMLAGFSARCNILSDGARQISAIHIRGDFVDLHSLLLRPMDHSVVALTDLQVAKVPHARLRAISEEHPHLTRLLWLLTLIDSAIFRQSLVAAGQLPATGQIARFVCEMYTRMALVGLARDFAFELPMTQTDLADTMGLSGVHINRCLQSLRRSGVLVWDGPHVEILDWPALRAIADYDETYLNLEPHPR